MKHTDCKWLEDEMCVCPARKVVSDGLEFTHIVLPDKNAEADCKYFEPKSVD